MSYDRMDNIESFEGLRGLIENIYINEYLGKLLPAWNAALDVKTAMREDNSQLRFFDRKIRRAKEKTVVIISDALRYEVGLELFERLKDDANCKADMSYMIGVLPAYTQLGMAALLPHKTLEIKPDGFVLVDGLPSDGTEKREAVLELAKKYEILILEDNPYGELRFRGDEIPTISATQQSNRRSKRTLALSRCRNAGTCRNGTARTQRGAGSPLE